MAIGSEDSLANIWATSSLGGTAALWSVMAAVLVDRVIVDSGGQVVMAAKK